MGEVLNFIGDTIGHIVGGFLVVVPAAIYVLRAPGPGEVAKRILPYWLGAGTAGIAGTVREMLQYQLDDTPNLNLLDRTGDVAGHVVGGLLMIWVARRIHRRITS